MHVQQGRWDGELVTLPDTVAAAAGQRCVVPTRLRAHRVVAGVGAQCHLAVHKIGHPSGVSHRRAIYPAMSGDVVEQPAHPAAPSGCRREPALDLAGRRSQPMWIAHRSNIEVIDRLQCTDDDLHTALADIGHHLRVYRCDERSQALRQLVYAEPTRLPRPDHVGRGRLPRPCSPMSRRHLPTSSPDCRSPASSALRADAAAEQFITLLTGPIETRSRADTRRSLTPRTGRPRRPSRPS
jgi:hypothetical protein